VNDRKSIIAWKQFAAGRAFDDDDEEQLMKYRAQFMHVSEDERHHESDEWKKEGGKRNAEAQRSLRGSRSRDDGFEQVTTNLANGRRKDPEN